MRADCMSLFCAAGRDRPESAAKSALTIEKDRACTGGALFIVGRGGGGHKASAISVRDCLQHGPRAGSAGALPVSIDLIDASDVLARAIPGASGANGDDVYNWCLQNGWYGIAGVLGYFASLSVGLFQTMIDDAFAKLWLERRPTVVVSFVPFLNATMRRTLSLACPGVRLVTVVTDFASSAAHPWIDPLEGEEADCNHIVVAGTQDVVDTAEELGYKHIVRTSGMVVNPVYYLDEPRERQAEGGGSRPTVVIFFGGHPPSRAQAIAEHVLEGHSDCRVVVLCGSNDALEEGLRQRVGEYGRRLIVESFLPASAIRDYLTQASCVIGKPGPGVAAEVAVCRVPLVLERSVGLAQEEIVQAWIEEAGLGVVVDDLENLPADLLERADGCRGALAAQRNTAVFEVADCLRALVSKRRAEESEEQREAEEIAEEGGG